MARLIRQSEEVGPPSRIESVSFDLWQLGISELIRRASS